MNTKIQLIPLIVLLLIILSCSNKIINLTENNLQIINRAISSIDKATNAVMINDKIGDGMAILEGVNFEAGTIELELKGEDIRGKSFVGVAFNIQNDSTYEAVYFRPFNFQAKQKISREHSVQYISHPKQSWRFLRTNFEGQYEAEYPRRPAPDAWFGVSLKINGEIVEVYDKASNSLLLAVKRLEQQQSNRIALWMGYNSKGGFRNLKIKN